MRIENPNINTKISKKPVQKTKESSFPVKRNLFTDIKCTYFTLVKELSILKNEPGICDFLKKLNNFQINIYLIILKWPDESFDIRKNWENITENFKKISKSDYHYLNHAWLEYSTKVAVLTQKKIY